MYIFTRLEEIYLSEIRAITWNSKGEGILVGLTLEETSFYMKYSNDLNRSHSSKDKQYYLVLHEKHEIARLEVLAAENQLRIDNHQLH